MNPTDKISDHFTFGELVVSRRGVANEPGDAEIKALRLLAANVLEPVRAALGVPLRVNSGFRSPALNEAAHGSPTSQHMKGEAADVVPVGLDPEVAMRKIAGMVRESGLPVDQAILYRGGKFLHLSFTATRAPRRQLLVTDARGGAGGPYAPYKA